VTIGDSVARKIETSVSSSSSLFAVTNLKWLGLRWASVVKLGWEGMEYVFQGKSPHAGRIKTIRNGVLVVVENARAYRTGFRRSPGSKSGIVWHEAVHR
jgi:hypothetical protein